MTNNELIKVAKAAMQKSYAPYSKFSVGAVILTDDDKMFSGCNIENASYGGTNCAERTALFKAVSEGYRKFKKIAIISNSKDYTYPCGICRQVLAEFGLDIEILAANFNEEYKSHSLSELLPYAFTSKDLRRENINE